MDPIKDAFLKIKQDMENLQSQISFTYQELQDIKRTLEKQQKQTQELISKATQQMIPTHPETPTDNSAQYPPISQISSFSTGNRGVPTDRQTNRQTDQQTQNQPQRFVLTDKKDPISQIDRVAEVLNSLDSLKKEIRTKFKRLTSQEMLIFSTIYQLEAEGFVVDYSAISSKLALSESSIRDYVLKIIRKGIPLVKTKHNNKKVSLSILPDLKKIASLETILQLREI